MPMWVCRFMNANSTCEVLRNTSIAIPGKRQDNSSRERRGMHNVKGVRFFADDEDEFGLEDILQVRLSWQAPSSLLI